MSTWSFSKDSANAAGANTTSGYKAGGAPFLEADTLASKRNVVLTSKGWVRKLVYTDTHGNSRVKEEVLVAANPGTNANTTDGYANVAYHSFPEITVMQLGANTATGEVQYANTANVQLYVSWSEPLFNTANLTIECTNTTASGAPFNLIANTTLVGANNTAFFKGAANGGAGTYKFAYQTITAAGGTLTSQTFGEAANLVVTGSVSNSLVSYTGNVTSTFTVV